MKSLPTSARWAKDFLIDGIEAIEHQYERHGAAEGLSSGLRHLDLKMDGGLQAGEMIVIAGRPCMGKTALALGIVEHTAIDSRLPVVIFALENSARYLAQRLLCSRASVDLNRVRAGRLTGGDFSRFGEAASCLADAPLLVDDAHALTTQVLGHRLRHYVREHGVKLAVIDHLQLLRSDMTQAKQDHRAGSGAVSGDIKSLARELKIPIVVLCPLNRNLEHRTCHRPRLEDIKGSRLIARDADVVILLFREEYYANTATERRKARGKVTLIVAKEPRGLTGDVTLRFEEKFVRFREID